MIFPRDDMKRFLHIKLIDRRTLYPVKVKVFFNSRLNCCPLKE